VRSQLDQEIALIEAALVRRETDLGSRRAELEARREELEARREEFHSQKESWEAQRAKREERAYPPSQPAAPFDRLDEEPAPVAPQPPPAPDGLPPSVEEEWWAETEPAGASPAAPDEQTEDEPVAEFDDHDRVLDGLVCLAKSKTWMGRIRGVISRWLGGEQGE